MSYLVDRFKSKVRIFTHNDKRFNYRTGHDGCVYSNYGIGDNSNSDLPLPKTIVRLREARFFSEKLKENLAHYDSLNRRVFKRLLGYNDSVLDNISNSYVYSANWHSLKLYYDISLIEQVAVFDNALAHIEERIPSFKSRITEIQTKTQELNHIVETTMDTIKSKVANALGEFNITFEDDSPISLHKLQSYWFDILYRYKNENKWYTEIIAELRPFNNELKDEGNYLRWGPYGVANLPTDKDKDQFVSSVMDLIKDDQIWLALFHLVRDREEIGDKIKSLTRFLQKMSSHIIIIIYFLVLLLSSALT
jgi:hypothetical protein